MSVMKAPSRITQSLDSTNSRDLLAAHRPFVQPGKQRMPLADDALAQDRADHGNAGPFGEGQQLILQAEAMDFHVGDDYRAAGGGDPPRGLRHGLGQHLRVARRRAEAVV